MVGAGVGDDAVPDDGGVVDIARARPVCRYVYEELLCIPCKEGREVGFQREADDGILFLLRGVVVGSALDTVEFRKTNGLDSLMYSEIAAVYLPWLASHIHLNIVRLYDTAGGARRAEICGGDECAQDKGDCGEEAEDILQTGEGAVHAGQLSGAPAERSDGIDIVD